MNQLRFFDPSFENVIVGSPSKNIISLKISSNDFSTLSCVSDALILFFRKCPGISHLPHCGISSFFQAILSSFKLLLGFVACGNSFSTCQLFHKNMMWPFVYCYSLIQIPEELFSIRVCGSLFSPSDVLKNFSAISSVEISLLSEVVTVDLYRSLSVTF